MKKLLLLFFLSAYPFLNVSAQDYVVIKASCEISLKSSGKSKNSSFKYSYVMNPIVIDKEVHTEDILKKAFDAYLKHKHKDAKVNVGELKIFPTLGEAKKYALEASRGRGKRTYMTSTFLKRYLRENAKATKKKKDEAKSKSSKK